MRRESVAIDQPLDLGAREQLAGCVAPGALGCAFDVPERAGLRVRGVHERLERDVGRVDRAGAHHDLHVAVIARSDPCVADADELEWLGLPVDHERARYRLGAGDAAPRGALAVGEPDQRTGQRAVAVVEVLFEQRDERIPRLLQASLTADSGGNRQPRVAVVLDGRVVSDADLAGPAVAAGRRCRSPWNRVDRERHRRERLLLPSQVLPRVERGPRDLVAAATFLDHDRPARAVVRVPGHVSAPLAEHRAGDHRPGDRRAHRTRLRRVLDPRARPVRERQRDERAARVHESHQRLREPRLTRDGEVHLVAGRRVDSSRDRRSPPSAPHPAAGARPRPCVRRSCGRSA